MPITIGSNIQGLRAIRQLDSSSRALTSTFERLSSGLRINRASDDAAGLAVASATETKTRVYGRAIQNINDGISYLSIADGALSQLSELVIRQRELAEQSSSGTFSNQQRRALDREFQALAAEYSRVLESSSFNGLNVFDANQSSVTLQLGYGTAESLGVGTTDTLGRAAGTGTFTAAGTASYGGFVGPEGAFVADLNNDGKNDVLIGTAGGNDTFLGNGQGGFSATLNSGSAALIADIGDINNDGIVDFLGRTSDSGGSNPTGAVYRAFIGRGDGTFAAGESFTSYSQSNFGKLNDLDGDGNLDFTTISSHGILSVFKGSGGGTFSVAYSASWGSLNQNDLTIADFNADGYKDIAMANNIGGIRIAQGGAGLTFQAGALLASGRGFERIEAADFNNDGRTDIAAYSFYRNDVSTFINQGSGSFAAELSSAVGAAGFGFGDLKVADMNDDGNKDFVFGNTNSQTIMVALGNGAGGVTTFNTIAQSSARLAAVGDLNGDGIKDIVGGPQSPNQTVQAFLGNAEPTRRFIKQDDNSLDTVITARKSLDYTETLLQSIANQRGSIGASLSRLGTASAALSVRRLEYSASTARITNADIALDTSNLIQQRLLQQIGSAVLAQSKLQPEIALRLLT